MSVDQISQINRRDLLLEQKLQGLSKKSLPSKEMEGTPPTNLINSVQGDINLRDLGIEEQLQKISRNAIKDVLGWKPTQIKSDVTNEMIQEYQDELANSFYDDPITGKRLKYVPVGSDLTLEEYTPQDILTEDDIESTRARIRSLTATRKATERLIIDELERLEEIKSSVEFQEETKRKSAHKGFYDKQFLRENPDLVALTENHYLNYVLRKENEINGYRARIFEIDGDIAALEEMLRQNQRARSDNQAQKDKVSKANFQLLKERSDELNLLNSGLNLTRQPNESDEDFRQRLIDVGQVEFDETAIQQAAGRRAMLKFKTNMKDITRNNILIENIIKSVDPSRLFMYNKFFEAIKTKFKEIYGRATFKDEDYPELINIFDNIIGKVNLSNARPQIAEPPPYATVVGELPSSSTFDARNPLLFSDPQLSQLPDDIQYEKLRQAAEKAESAASSYPPNYDYPPDLTPAAEARLAEATPIDVLLAALPPLPPPAGKAGRPALATTGDNPYELRREVLVARYKEAYGGSRGNTLTSKNDDGSAAGIGDIFDRLQKKGIIQPRSYYEKQSAAAAEGEGLKHEKLPKLAHFGKIMINPHALYYQNTLIITTNGRNHLTGYRNVKVSDDFVSIIMKILNGGEPTHKEIQKLDLAEKELYDNVIHLAHLHKKIEHNLSQTRQAMKHRFELLNGEVGAGNTNKAIKKELTDLVHKMAYAGMISHHQRNKFVKSL